MTPRAQKKATVQQFTKIKSTGKKVELRWVTSEKGADHEHHVTSAQHPKPDFPKALNAFVPFVVELMGLADTAFDSDLEVTGLSIDTGEDDRRGLIITCRKKLARTNGPLIFNTPHIREPKDEGGEPPASGVWLEGMAEALARAEGEASGFLAGERAQTELAFAR